MLPLRSSFLHPAIVAGVLVLGLSAVPSAVAQDPAPTGNAARIREGGPPVPGVYQGGGPQQGTSREKAPSGPVLTPGYFDVVCPAMCYGAAFHVCGRHAFGGSGYYGPFRRLWGYGTYGPNFNVGPSQYGLQGCQYVAMRAGKGSCDHHSYQPHCYRCGPCGSLALLYGDGGVPPPRVIPPPGGAANLPPPPPAKGPAKPPPEILPPPTEDKAQLRFFVPENAEVLVEGCKTTATGAVREFITPPLTPGKNMIYSVLVRYTDASGKPVEESHSIRVRANDRLDIDCTKSAPSIVDRR